ncbi:MAG: signal peptidase II [Sedimentisphaerales bacterium]|nr:signal peptidase II [Sedimentisphaerales bacterium]
MSNIQATSDNSQSRYIGTSPERKRGDKPAAAGKRLPGAGEHLIFWFIAVIGLGLDLFTKSAAFRYVGLHGDITVVKGFLSLVAVTNDGAAFNLFAGKELFLILISFIALLIILGVFFFGGSRSILVNVSMGLLAAGICGNLYDRFFNDGLVRDFIDVVIWPQKHWPAFNVADSMLCIGVGLILVSSFFTEKPCQKHGPRQK